MWKKMIGIILLAACAGIITAAEKDDDKPDYMRIDAETAKVFPRVEHPLTLQRGLQNNTFFIAGEKVKPSMLTFRILNRNNLEVVSVDEWFQEEDNNLKISVAVIAEEGEKIAPERWKQVWPVKKPGKDVKRQPVSIAPGNGLVLDIPAQFLTAWIPEKSYQQRIALKVELNLRSVRAEPLIFDVKLRK
ncbi:MAG: hypothetical protein J6Q65_08460, partial [Lentisphaeria bacterium]|nr:hypothetical protein [Lentisphaeria bacterium]